MKLLVYSGLDTDSIPGYAKLAAFLERGDFRSAEVKKVSGNLYRARLNHTDRLLFSIYRHGDERYALILEHVPHHAYAHSRFLAHGAKIDGSKIPVADAADAETAPQLGYVNPRLSHFHLLDKILSFDDAQEAVYRQPEPLIVIGSAGSGKTAITLEKMRGVSGHLLYVTRSAFLAQNARALYYAHGYDRDDQEIDFLSFREYLESIHVPQGREITPPAFADWLARRRPSRAVRDAHRLFEEFQGAITGADVTRPYLSREEYLGLGVRQSIFPVEDRAVVYDLFEKYLCLLRDGNWFDPNLISHEWLARVEPCYDFVVVDEVQDLTNVQLRLILGALHDARRFLLCGDANQVVHPNFFSWAKVKTLFWQARDTAEAEATAPADLIRILNSNFRNSPQVTEVANRLLRIKQLRYGSVDRESNYLVTSRGPTRGRAVLLEGGEALERDLDERTAQSARFAILVLHPEQKPEVRRRFHTPLVFSVQEAKGLEYENVLLYHFVSTEAKRFAEVSGELTGDDLTGELRYARARDKSNKSLEVYKFYINSLYVAVTRAVRNLYLLESHTDHPLLRLLGLGRSHGAAADIEEPQHSSLDEWRREAQRLALQGKEEQAEEIRNQILHQHEVPWKVLDEETVAALRRRALEGGDKAASIQLLEYAITYRDRDLIESLARVGVGAARRLDKAAKVLESKYHQAYRYNNPVAVLREVDRYGPDFRNPLGRTPLMIASLVGNAALIERLLERGADRSPVDANGLDAYQIALLQTCTQPRYARTRLAEVHRLLAPDTLDLQVDERLVKLDRRSMEYLMLNLAMALFYVRLRENLEHAGRFLSAGDFEQALAHFPEEVVAQRRKRRAYISSILSKNEVSRTGPYNRKLFRRIRHGQYLPNPALSLRVRGHWEPIYGRVRLERLGEAAASLRAHLATPVAASPGARPSSHAVEPQPPDPAEPDLLQDL